MTIHRTAASAATTPCAWRENLASKEAGELRMFSLGDAAACAHARQKVRQGYYNVADVIPGFMRHKGTVSISVTCMDARGITDNELMSAIDR